MTTNKTPVELAIEALEWRKLLTCPYEILDRSYNDHPIFIVMQKTATEMLPIEGTSEQTLYHRKCSSKEEARFFLKEKWSEYICKEIRTALRQMQEPAGDGKLLPCPFCGCKEIDLSSDCENQSNDPFAEDWLATCWHCGASPMSDRKDKETAVSEWNTRAHLTAPLPKYTIEKDEVNNCYVLLNYEGITRTPLYLHPPEPLPEDVCDCCGWENPMGEKNRKRGMEIHKKQFCAPLTAPLPEDRQEAWNWFDGNAPTVDRDDCLCEECKCARRIIKTIRAALSQPAAPSVDVEELLEEVHKNCPKGFYETKKEVIDYLASQGHLTPNDQSAAPFQKRVNDWMQKCFGAEISADKIERNHRFLEESLELVQSTGCTKSEALQLVDYVYGRDIGETPQEVGGVMVTLAALCLANDVNMDDCGETELKRVWVKMAKIREKQANKPKHSPLPEHTTQTSEGE